MEKQPGTGCAILMVYSNFCTTRTGLTVHKEKPIDYNTETSRNCGTGCTGFSPLKLVKEIKALLNLGNND